MLSIPGTYASQAGTLLCFGPEFKCTNPQAHAVRLHSATKKKEILPHFLSKMLSILHKRITDMLREWNVPVELIFWCTD